MGSLSNLYISQSYQSLIHLGSDTGASGEPTQLQDGLGTNIGIYVNTNGEVSASSYSGSVNGIGNVSAFSSSVNSRILAITSSTINTGSLVTTASFNSYTSSQDFKNTTFATTSSLTNLSASLYFTDTTQSVNISNISTSVGLLQTFSGSQYKADSSSFNSRILAATGSSIYTGSFATTGSNTFIGNQNINSQLIVDTGGNQLQLKSGGNGTTTFNQQSASSLSIFQTQGANGIDIYSNVNISGSLTASGNISSSGNIYGANITGSTIFTGSFATTSSVTALSQSLYFTDTTQSNNIASNSSSIGLLQTFSGSQYKADSSSFSSRILAAGGASQIQDEGSILGTATSFNFIGAGVTTTLSSGTASVTIPGGGGSIYTGSFAITGSNTFSGSQIINGNVNITGSLTASGLKYPTTDGTAGQFIITDGVGTLAFDDVHVLLEDVRYGENITLGDPLYVSGSNGNRAVVYKADAAVSSKMPVIYIAKSTAVANTNTTAITLGLITGVTTTGYAPGTTIYVAEGGGWSQSRPSGSASIVQPLGIVTKEGSGGSGRGLVLNPGPAFLPNIQTGYAWVGNGTNQPTAVATSSFSGGGSINTGSFATTGSNSFTGSQTINGDIILTGSSAEIQNAKGVGIYNSLYDLDYSLSMPIQNTIGYIDELNLPHYYNGGVQPTISASATINNHNLVKVTPQQWFNLTASVGDNHTGILSVEQSTGWDDINNTFGVHGNLVTSGSVNYITQRGLSKIGIFPLGGNPTQPYIGQPIYVDDNGYQLTTGYPTGSRVLRYGYVASFEQSDPGNMYIRQIYVDPVWEKGETITDLNVSSSLRVTGSALITGSLGVTGNLNVNGQEFITGSITTTLDSTFNGVTVGLGSSSINTNLAIGSASLQSNTGNTSVGIGSNTLAANKSAGNIAIGASALKSQLFTGNGYNIAIGANTLALLGSGSAAAAAQLNQNTIVGASTGIGMIVGARNTIMGSSAFQGANNVERNTGIGRGVFSAIGDGAVVNGSGSKYNTAIGHNALFQLQSGSNNTMIHGGSAAGEGFLTGSNNTTIGIDSGLPSSMEANTIIGRSIAGLSSPLSNNVILADGQGNIALQKNGSSGLVRIGTGLEVTGSTYFSELTGSLAGYSASVDSRILAIPTINTSSFATTGSNSLTGSQIITGSLTITGSVATPPVAITISSNTASIDFSKGSIYTLTLVSGSNTYITASNLTPGQTANLVVTQASALSGSIVWASAFKFPSGSAYTGSKVVNAVDLISFITVNNTTIYSVGAQNLV